MAPTGSAEKRAREEAEAAEVSAPETRRAKRRRWDDGDALAAPPTAPPAIPPPHPPGASAAAPAKPALPNVDALAKAKAVLQKQKELAAKLASVPKLANPAAAPSGADAARKTALARALEVAAAAKSAKPAAATASAAPRALRLNAAGEEIDEDGNVIVAKVREVSTFKVNEKTNKLEEFAALERAAEAEAAAEADDLAWMDPRMGAAGRRRERKGGFQVREHHHHRAILSPSPSRLDSIVCLGSPFRSRRVFPFGFRFASFQSPADAASAGLIDGGTTAMRNRTSSVSRGGSRGAVPTAPLGVGTSSLVAILSTGDPARFASYTLSRGLLLSRCNFYACDNEICSEAGGAGFPMSATPYRLVNISSARRCFVDARARIFPVSVRPDPSADEVR